MKKLLFLLMIALSACSSDDGGNSSQPEGQKLVQIISSEDGVSDITYYPDGKIRKITTDAGTNQEEVTEFVYSADKLITLRFWENAQAQPETNFEYSGNRITSSITVEGSVIIRNEYSYNSSGNVQTVDQYDNDVLSYTTTYNYDPQGNVSTVVYSDGPSINIQYDTKKNPVYYALPVAFSKLDGISKNNTTMTGPTTYTYTYSTDDLPLTQSTGGQVSTQYIYE